MKVAFIVFPISNVGGIATRLQSMVTGLERNGHRCSVYRVTKGKKNTKGEFAIRHNSNSLKIESSIISVYCDKTFFNKFDRLIFLHSAPHEAEKFPDCWMDFYSIPDTYKITFFSDVYWDKYYPNIEKVIGEVDRVLCVNQGVMDYVKKTMGIEVELYRHGFIIPSIKNMKKFSERKKEIIWANQWRGWKGILQVLNIAPDLSGYEFSFYGSGREYYNYKKNELYKKNVKFDLMNPEFEENENANIKIFGTCSPRDIFDKYKDFLFSIDMTGFSEKYYGHYNQTSIQSMPYGCVPILNEKIISPYSHIPKEACYSVTTSNFVETIKNIDPKEYDEKQICGYEFMKKYHSMDEIVNKFLVEEK